MKRISVFVATTGGPVRIERITPERAPQSMMCLRRTSTILPISGDYDDFVRPGSGVIEREFGPFEDSSFRLDVSAPIGAGRSWQLGVFVAHAIAASQDHALAGDGAEFDEAVVLTGRVDYDLTVEPVDHIPEKLAGLDGVFADLDGRPARLIVPAGRNHDSASRVALPDGVTLVSTASAWDACRAIGLRATDAMPRAPTAARPTSRRQWGLAVLAGVVAAGVVVTVIGTMDVSNWARDVSAAFRGGKETLPTTIKTDQPSAKVTPEMPSIKVASKSNVAARAPSLTLRVLARRPPPGRTCADVHFGGVDAVLTPVARNAQGAHLDSKSNSLCGLTFEVAPDGPGKFVSLVLKVRSGKMLNSEKTLPSALKGTVLLSSAVSWSIILPGQMREPFSYELFLIESDRPIDQAADLLHGQAVTKTVLRRLAEDGKTVKRIAHKVMN